MTEKGDIIKTDSASRDGANPTISSLLLWITRVESLVLVVAGIGLLLFPSEVAPRWPWELSRFNAFTIGLVYASALVATLMMVASRRWAPTRIVLPLIALFTTIVLVISLVYLDRFDFSKYSTWIWFALYIIIPANALYHMWLYRDLQPYRPQQLNVPWRLIITVPTMALGAYGVGLLIAPVTLASFWPWPVDAFHGRMYSVAFLVPALGAYLVYRGANRIEQRTGGLTVAVEGALAVVGLFLIDLQVDKVEWQAAGTWLWLGGFAVLFLSGTGLLWQSRLADVTGR